MSKEQAAVANQAPAEAGGLFETATDREAMERAQRAAAPVAADVEAIGALDPETRKALYALLSSLADNKYLLGRRYAEWCTGAPMLESAVAAAAMAQDELGHARSFYPLLRGFPESTDADTQEDVGWQDRPTSAMSALDQKFTTWDDFVVANFLLDSALTVLLEAATDSPYEPLRQRARKILQEEEPHWVHAAGWMRRLTGNPNSRGNVEASLERMWDDAFTWFGEAEDSRMQQLTSEGILASGPDALRERLLARVAPVLEQTGLVDSLTSRSLPWDRWDARARRLRTGG